MALHNNLMPLHYFLWFWNAKNWYILFFFFHALIIDNLNLLLISINCHRGTEATLHSNRARLCQKKLLSSHWKFTHWQTRQIKCYINMWFTRRRTLLYSFPFGYKYLSKYFFIIFNEINCFDRNTNMIFIRNKYTEICFMWFELQSLVYRQ